jgi:hypothetical protein
MLQPVCYLLSINSKYTLTYSGVRGYFRTMTNDEEDIVTTTIMHFKTFNLETIDNRTGASGLEDESVNQPPLRTPDIQCSYTRGMVWQA